MVNHVGPQVSFEICCVRKFAQQILPEVNFDCRIFAAWILSETPRNTWKSSSLVIYNFIMVLCIFCLKYVVQIFRYLKIVNLHHLAHALVFSHDKCRGYS